VIGRVTGFGVWPLAALLLLVGCSDRAAGKAPAQVPHVPVTVSDAVEKIVPIQLTAVPIKLNVAVELAALEATTVPPLKVPVSGP